MMCHVSMCLNYCFLAAVDDWNILGAGIASSSLLDKLVIYFAVASIEVVVDVAILFGSVIRDDAVVDLSLYEILELHER